MQVVSTGIYTLLTTGAAWTTLSGHGVTGVYFQLAPQSATLPYIVFNQQSGTDLYNFSGRDHITLLYQIKAITTGHSALLAGQIANSLDTILTDSAPTVSGYTVKRIRRESHVEYSELDAGINYNHAGGIWRIDIE